MVTLYLGYIHTISSDCYIHSQCIRRCMWGNLVSATFGVSSLQFLLWPDDGLFYKSKLVANRTCVNDLLGPILELINILVIYTPMDMSYIKTILFRFSNRYSLVHSSRVAGRSRTLEYVTLCINRLRSHHHHHHLCWYHHIHRVITQFLSWLPHSQQFKILPWFTVDFQ